MKRISLGVLAILFALCVFKIPPASAALWEVKASRADSGASDFVILFDDREPYGSVSYADVLKDDFLGVTLTQNNKSYLYPFIEGIPTLVILDGASNPILTLIGKSDSDNLWDFSGASEGPPSAHRPADFWTYTATLVPIPSAALLLGSGLICFIGLRRRLGSR